MPEIQPTRPALAIALDEQQCWEAVLRKDDADDGKYLFAVKTTGIYCRPSCPSRTPKRMNVEFFADAPAARQAGYRACLRCAPDGLSKRQQQTAAILKACRLIESSSERIQLNDLAERVGLSAHHFHRTFKEVTGVTPLEYFKSRQIAQIGAAIRSEASITEAIYDAGFGSSSRFYENADAMLGMKPRAYKAGGQGEVIRVGVRSCALGLVLVAATERGVCTIEFGDDAQELQMRVSKRFPHSLLLKEDAQFDAWLEKILAHIQAPATALDLPLDIRGTAFQQQVWKALRDIAPGQTHSYAQVAEKIGKPKAVRAVATACASNVLALAIPCHRVVRSNGELSGYRWGPERKKELLDAEAGKLVNKKAKKGAV
jgi:AraC family transcriptional regulator, regulatory protein of adaptative response / methylated-DNA-[protein]-cysteine methyltransferase